MRNLVLCSRVIPGRHALALVLFVGLLGGSESGCSVNPVSGVPEVTLISAKQEQEIGAEEAKKVEQQMGLLDDDQFVPYINQLGQRLAEQSPRKDVPYQ